nr:uncharacterized protein LOC123757017 [Procambarus clarkii]
MPDGNVYFKGQETCNITQEGNKWILRSRLHRREWQLRRSQPVGRRRWCSGDENTTLTLTSCNILQFSSHDGVCLPRSQRCDGNIDSPDGSDEEHCGERLINKGPGYNTFNSPFHGEIKKGYVLYQFDLYSIDKITTEHGVAKVQAGIRLVWTDARLRFIDTKMKANYMNCTDIWIPKLVMTAGEFSGPHLEPQIFFDYCFVHWKKKPPEEQNMNDPLMGKLTSSRQVNITRYMKVSMEYPCHLKVYRYPFGTYLCNISFSLLRAYLEMSLKPVDGEVGAYNVPYVFDHDLLDYHLMNVTAEAHPEHVMLTLHLTGQFDYHLLNSFAPSALMFFISYATLFFPITDFNERIMVSLTSMLVLAGFFAQASDSYIKTPYFKLIDIWYFVLIMLCFAVVISNTVVNSMRIKGSRSFSKMWPASSNTSIDDQKLKANTRAQVFNIICKIVLLLCFQLLVVLYFLFGNEII